MKFEPEHEQIIKNFMKQDPGSMNWKDSRINGLKVLIKESLYKMQNKHCCYCRVYIGEQHKGVIDIEHILPKKKEDYHRFILRNENLALSCRRCNFTPYKGQRIDFLTKLTFDDEDWKTPEYYKFIHPRFENLGDHFRREMSQQDTNTAIRFKRLKNEAKTDYHYNFFGFKEIECGSFDAVQSDDYVDETQLGRARIFDKLQQEN